MFTQISILILGILSVYCSMELSIKKRKLAPIFGLMSQPFWLYSTFTMHAWGMFWLSIIYTVIMIRGIYNYWFAKETK